MNATLRRWAAEYEQRRSAGAPGWAGADSYRVKQERLAEALAAQAVKAPATFLELGCGAGNIALWMAAQGFTAYGVDVVPAAIQWARDKARAAAVSARFVVADLGHLPMFRDGQFDLVFDGDCFHLIRGAHRAGCFREVRRVLKAGGLLVAGGNVRAATATDPSARRLVTPDGLEYVLQSGPELCQELRDAGFAIVGVKHYPKRGSHPAIKECLAIHATR